MKTTCSVCNEIKVRIKIGDKYNYKDSSGRSWRRKVCPDCSAQYFKVKRNTKPLLIKRCCYCSTEFNQTHQSQIFCSDQCRHKGYLSRNATNRRNKRLKSCLTCGRPHSKVKYCCVECRPQPRPKPRKTKVISNCSTCGKEFSTHISSRLYCKPGHSPAAQKAKRERRHVARCKQPISKFYRKDIASIYNKRTEGLVVDHIVPLNHPDVCGLHVPWNLQLLTPEENSKKSNLWDGTMDNKLWVHL